MIEIDDILVDTWRSTVEDPAGFFTGVGVLLFAYWFLFMAVPLFLG